MKGTWTCSGDEDKIMEMGWDGDNAMGMGTVIVGTGWDGDKVIRMWKIYFTPSLSSF